ncbi:MAG TPA: hypothetical protein VJX92_03275 [Methylomirabilota bacterium]|nr:hypothetical protein [Methylomirabilota bacterium]
MAKKKKTKKSAHLAKALSTLDHVLKNDGVLFKYWSTAPNSPVMVERANVLNDCLNEVRSAIHAELK